MLSLALRVQAHTARKLPRILTSRIDVEISENLKYLPAVWGYLGLGIV